MRVGRCIMVSMMEGMRGGLVQDHAACDQKAGQNTRNEQRAWS